MAGSSQPSPSEASEAGTPVPTAQAESLFPWSNIKQLMDSGSTEQLIIGVNTASGLLKKITGILERLDENPAVQEIVDDAVNLQKRTNARGAVVGVVGSTGSGKSSVINAVLDEECLVPTNAMRACTAAITEITWNHDEDPARLYKAEVEFIKSEEWEHELRILFNDLYDQSGHALGDMTDPDSQAGITLAKVKAVYPNLKDSDLLQGAGIVNDLVKNEKVNDVLGLTMCLHAETAPALQQQLQPYIDSKEKKRGDQASQDDETTMSTWPLVKVVRVYTKANVLQSGLVLVDLPGVHDSNAARAAMAEDYMRKCNAIWVVAPITRAVDDKSAHALLGEARQRQLQLDGMFSNLTMICSKADDISVTEVTKHVEGDELYAAKLAKIDAEITEAKQLLEDKRATLEDLERRLKDAEIQQKQSERRIAELGSALGTSDGNEIMVSPAKRKLVHTRLPEPKRVLRGDVAASDSSSDTAGSGSESDEVEEVAMSKQEVKQEMERLRREIKEQKGVKKALKPEHKPLVKEVKALEKAYKETVKEKRRRLCIEYRNSYSRSAVQTSFKLEARECDLERFAEEDDEGQIDDLQDPGYYDELARKLPVFCVSARAYLKLTGKLPHDEWVRGFDNVWDTEIPYLRKHAIVTADEFRSELCRRFLKDFLQIVRSLVLQVLMEGKPLEIEKELQQREMEHLDGMMYQLRLDLGLAEDVLCGAIEDVQKGISRKLTRGCQRAKDGAGDIVTGWFKKRDEGGIHHTTFKALCRREGRFQKPTGAIDLNEDLAKALKETVAHRWTKAFNNSIPSALEELGQTTARHIAEFRVEVEGRMLLKRSANAQAALSDLIRGYEQSLADMETRKEFVEDERKDASRQMTPAIAEVMAPTYRDCLNETGNGCYKRMKELVFVRVKQNEHMYGMAATRVRSHIRNAFAELVEHMIRKNIGKALATVAQMYNNLVFGINIFASLTETRDELRKLLDGTDNLFKDIQSHDVDMSDAINEEDGRASDHEDQHFSEALEGN